MIWVWIMHDRFLQLAWTSLLVSDTPASHDFKKLVHVDVSIVVHIMYMCDRWCHYILAVMNIEVKNLYSCNTFYKLYYRCRWNSKEGVSSLVKKGKLFQVSFQKKIFLKKKIQGREVDVLFVEEDVILQKVVVVKEETRFSNKFFQQINRSWWRRFGIIVFRRKTKVTRNCFCFWIPWWY